MSIIRRMCSGLRLRLLLLVVLTCSPLAALILYTASAERRHARASMSQQPLMITELAAQGEKEIIGQTRQLLLALTESASLQSLDLPACYRLLTDCFTSYPHYANLGVVRANGEILTTALPPVDQGNQVNRLYFQRALRTGSFSIGSESIGLTSGKPLVIFGCPVIDRSGQVKAVIFASLDLNWFRRTGAQLTAQWPKAARVLEIDDHGALLAGYPPLADGIKGDGFSPAVLSALLARSHGVVEARDAQRIPTIYAFARRHSRLVKGHVIEVVELPKRVLYAAADRVLWKSLAWLGIAAGFAMAVGWIGGKFLVLQPVRVLARSAHQWGAVGNNAHPEGERDQDELRELTRAIDQMARTLEQRERQRREAEETLATHERVIRELPVLPAAVYVCNPTGAIELYNHAATELWGYEPPDHYASLQFCGSYRLRHPNGAQLPHHESPMAQVLQTGEPVRNRELVIERPDGSCVSVLANVVALHDAEGLLIGAVSCLQDISDRKAAEDKLKESHQELQLLSRRLLESQETERRRIACELHDEVGQSLTVAEMNLQTVLRSPRSASFALPLKETIQAVERVLEQVHDLSLSLRPAMLDDLGLEPALRWYANRQASLAGLRVSFQIEPLEQRLDSALESACFRIAQEALTNTVRHARAKTLTVGLRQVSGRVRLSVRDDGIGFDVAALREEASRGASLGLLSMEERAVLAGGDFECLSTPGQGTEIRASFPSTRQRQVNSAS